MTAFVCMTGTRVANPEWQRPDRLGMIIQDHCGHISGTRAHCQSVDLRAAGRVSVLDSQRCGSLDNRLPIFGVRRDSAYGSLARDDNPIFPHIFVAIAKRGEPTIVGAVCCAGNMDYRPLYADIQFEFLWRRAFSAGCLAVFCFRHTLVSAVYVGDVRLRRHILRTAPYDIAASHPRELPIQRSRTPVPIADPLLSPKSADSSH
jgi:hypothetical protein